jgi:hypothetical protein
MADDRKRTENVCAKVTERMLIDINRLIQRDDIKLSGWLYGLIRRELYGRARAEESATSDADGAEGIPLEKSRAYSE